jgi:membrane fusion protein, multidrug efflux system
MSISVPARLSVALLALLPALVGCSNGHQQTKAAPPAPSVTVAKPIQRTLVDQDEYVGRFVAVDSVEVRARVSGYLAAIHFQDGQMVRKGDLLFTIDRRPFQIILDQARANLAQAKANLAYAESDLARGQHLVRDKTITEQSFDQRQQARNVAQAVVAANEAMVRQAELDYAEFSELRAPVGGRIGDRRVSVGNLVTGGTGGNTTLLATIVSLDPIRFEFTFDEASFLRYQRSEMASRTASTPVRLKLLDEESFAHEGRLDFVDNAINQSSGTIRGRAVFDNSAELFTPGMFGRLQVPGSPPYQALLVPDAAIATEQTHKFVLVADADNIARLKYVKLGQAVGDLRVIKEGLSSEDRVIVNGLMRARQGAKVAPREESAPPPSAGASAPAG